MLESPHSMASRSRRAASPHPAGPRKKRSPTRLSGCRAPSSPSSSNESRSRSASLGSQAPPYSAYCSSSVPNTPTIPESALHEMPSYEHVMGEGASQHVGEREVPIARMSMPVTNTASTTASISSPPSPVQQNRVTSLKPTKHYQLKAPTVTFQAPSIRYQPMDLETALYTLTSQELQEMVSESIRASSTAEFIGLLPPADFKSNIPAELESLDHSMASTQSRYKFNIHRRTMLLQALFALSESLNEKERETLEKLATQLSTTSMECDRLTENIFEMGDKMGQLTRISGKHCASAQAIALRKLNGKGNQISAAEERIRELEQELNESKRHILEMTSEMDKLNSLIRSVDMGDRDQNQADPTSSMIKTTEFLPIHIYTDQTSGYVNPQILATVPQSPLSPPSPTAPPFLIE